MPILVITTGGTIGALRYDDPQHPPAFSTMPPEGEDTVRTALQTSFSGIETRCIALTPRDSKLIDDAYRNEMLAAMEDAAERKILLTHGTDTMLKTADFFHEAFKTRPALAEKSLIITGAMVPLTNGKTSDGYLNIAYALECFAHPPQAMTKVNLVLCTLHKTVWEPQLYPYWPGLYEKHYDEDGRYSRLHERAEMNMNALVQKTGAVERN